jgi:O-acetyl-ADP-ribose deacetylase (regulator of RNase III)
MIRYTTGNLLDAGTDALVNTVNTVGVSGKGISLMFKDAFPDNFGVYQAACKEGKLKPGDILINERQDMLLPRWIVNFATKRHWRYPSRIEWIERGLAILSQEIAARRIRSIAIPPLGAGNGGLDWKQVRPLIANALTAVDCDIIVYEPTPTYQNIVKRNGVEKLTPARALMGEMIRRYEVMGFECSMIEAQKLAWFLSSAISQLGLENPISNDFQANRYGPYSDGVRHLLDRLDGSYLNCDRRVADAGPFEPIRFKHERRDDIGAYLTSPEVKPLRPALDVASDVIDGFQSPHGMELLATIDWLHRRAGVAMTVQAMFSGIQNWPGPDGAALRKTKAFTPRHVEVAIERLLAKSASETSLY